MTGTLKLVRITSIFIISLFIYPLPARSDDQLLNTKMVGKITMFAILSVTAFIVKKLVDKDVNDTVKIRKNLGTPDRAIDFREGFDQWRIEWHGNYVYAFRNGVFSYKREAVHR